MANKNDIILNVTKVTWADWGGTTLDGTAVPSDVLKGATFLSLNSEELQTGTLELSGTATAGNVLSGYTFYNTDAKTLQTGTMVNLGTSNIAISPTQYYQVSGYFEKLRVTVNMNGLTASPTEVLSGRTFYGNQENSLLTGTMTNVGAVSVTISAGSSYTVPSGYHNGGGTVTAVSRSPTFTKLGMWTSDNSSGYTFSASYDYAIISASYGRDKNANRGMWMSVSGCSQTDYGQSYGPMSDKSCEGGIITKILISPKSGNSVSWGPNTNGSKCAVSIVGISL